MPNTSMNIRMDGEVKKQAQALFAQFGLDMTTAVNMFLRQSIRQQGIPFVLQIDSFDSDTNQERLLRVAKRMERTGGAVNELIEDDETVSVPNATTEDTGLQQRIETINRILMDAIELENTVLTDSDWNEMVDLRSQTNAGLSRKVEI